MRAHRDLISHGHVVTIQNRVPGPLLSGGRGLAYKMAICSDEGGAGERASRPLARIHRRTPMDGVRKAEGGVRELQGK